MDKQSLPARLLAPKIVLGVVAHADDLEYNAAGSIATWIEQGAEVYYLILTNGDKGSADTTAPQEALCDIRRAEQEKAALLLGVKQVFFCEYNDCELKVTSHVTREITRVIRTIRPDTIVTWDPTMAYSVEHNFINHPDHRAAGQATLDAVFPLARDYLSCPELLHDEHLEPHRVSTVLLINFNNPTLFIDISSKIDIKMAAYTAHASQIDDKAVSAIRRIAAKIGQHAGMDYAEAFVRIDVE